MGFRVNPHVMTVEQIVDAVVYSQELGARRYLLSESMRGGGTVYGDKVRAALALFERPSVIAVGDRVIRTDTPCVPGKVLRVADGVALVIWGMDIGSGNRPQWEPMSALVPARDASNAGGV